MTFTWINTYCKPIIWIQSLTGIRQLCHAETRFYQLSRRGIIWCPKSVHYLMMELMIYFISSSSCSPGSTLSGKPTRNTDRHGAQSDGEPTHQHRRRHSLHSRARSHDQSHYSDTESVMQKRPPSGPIYTAPHNQGYNSGMSAVKI